jgi:hypothetical protein
LVSVLDLDNIAAPEDPASPRHSGGPAILMCALNDVKDIRKDRMTGAAKKADPMTRSRKKRARKKRARKKRARKNGKDRNARQWWSLSGSNR